MSLIDNTSEPRPGLPPRPDALDLSADRAFADLVNRRQELYEIERSARKAMAERKRVDVQIIAKLGDAMSALTADGDLVSRQIVSRDGFTVVAFSFEKLIITQLPLQAKN